MVFSVMAASIYILINILRRFPFVHTPKLIYLFDNSQSTRCEVVFHCGFDMRFPDD